MSCKHGNWEPCDECGAEGAIVAQAEATGERKAKREVAEALEELKSVLCDPEGTVCCTGRAGDRQVIQEALRKLEAAPEETP